MPVETIYTLEASNITISGGGQLSGITQGDGSHLVGLTITLDNNNWQTVEVFDDDADFADNDASQQLEGAQTYDGVSYADNLLVEAEYSLTLEDPDGNTYVVYGFNINEPDVASFATIEGLAFQGGVGEFPPIGVPLTVVSSAEGPINPYVDLASPPCIARGTIVETLQGPQLVENLRVGDEVRTLEGGFCPVRSVLSTSLTAANLQANNKLLPIRITAGALGQGLPYQDLIVSRQHRVMVNSPIVARMFGTDEVLVPACKLIDLPGIFVDNLINEVEYFHIVLDTHEVIFTSGAPTESLFLGPQALKSLSAAAREEIAALFPHLFTTNSCLDPAVPLADNRRAGTLIARHLKNQRSLLDTFSAERDTRQVGRV